VCERALGALLLVACVQSGQPRVVPSSIRVDAEAQALRIVGVDPVEYLDAIAPDLTLDVAFAAELGGVATRVVTADGSGISVTLAQALPAGAYPLDLHGKDRTWHVDDALEVVAVSGAVDGGIDGNANSGIDGGLDGGVDVGVDGGIDAGIDAGSDAPTDASASACPAAPHGCTAFQCATGSSCYYVCDAKTYSAAQAQCSAHSIGCVATIDDLAEDDCIAANVVPTVTDAVWIGYVESGSSQSWGWTCSDGSTFTDWGLLQPSLLVNETAAAMVNGGVWVNADPTTSLRYVCKLP